LLKLNGETTVKYLVKTGSLHFEQGTFSRGDVIDVTVERAALLDQNDIQLIPEALAAITELPKDEAPPVIEVLNKKRVAKKPLEVASVEV
jgi:hypothetical protein